LRFVVDQQLPELLADWLRASGLDAVHVREIGLAQAPDQVIWAEVVRADAVMISRDSDFPRLNRNGDARVVWLRFGNCGNPELLAIIAARWAEIEAALFAEERVIEVRA
jgi:predicted nuclease of predicted toxin-antitoxin system